MLAKNDDGTDAVLSATGERKDADIAAAKSVSTLGKKE